MTTGWHSELVTVNGLMGEARKVVTFIDNGAYPYVALVPTTFSYEMTVYGDAGEEIDQPFDGVTIHWKRVSSSSWKSDYVGMSLA